jgi:hypothetical protein
MKTIQHPSNNMVLEPPPGFTKEQCVAIPITRVVYKDSGISSMLSFWELDDIDIEAILSNKGVVVLEVLGTVHPPIRLRVALKD